MSEKKSFVIKVKYPAPGKGQAKYGAENGLVSEWNFKRIGVALAGILGLMLSAGYFLGGSEETKNVAASSPPAASAKRQTEVDPSAAKSNEPVSAPVPKRESTEKEKGNNVIRALLTNKVEKNEPLKTISLPLKIGRKETVGVYYFVELKGMKEKTVTHEWYLNDQLVSQKKVNISSDPWRTSSKQIISYTMDNDWRVRLVDEAGNTLNEKKFNLELK